MAGLHKPFVIIHDLEDARRATRRARVLNSPIRLLSAPGAAGTIGPAVFREIINEALGGQDADELISAFIDCADNSGFALKALDEGCNVRIDTDEKTLTKLREIAGDELEVITGTPDPAIDLSSSSDEELDHWLQQSIH